MAMVHEDGISLPADSEPKMLELVLAAIWHSVCIYQMNR